MNLPSWTTFLKEHDITSILEIEDPSIVSDILHPTHEPLDDSDKADRLISIASSPSIIILTLDPFDNSIFSTFHHDHISPPTHFTQRNHRKCIGLSGFQNPAIPIFLDMNDLFASTEDTHATPTLLDFISYHDKSTADLTQIPVMETNLKHIRKAIPIHPHFIHTVTTGEWKSPWDLLHLFIKIIHHRGVSRPRDPNIPAVSQDDATTIPDQEHHTTVTEDQDNQEVIVVQDNNEWEFAEGYTEVLTSLWAFATHETIPHLHTKHSAASSIEAMLWSNKAHQAWKNSFTSNKNLNPHFTQEDDNLSTAASSIGRLQDTLDAHARRFASPSADDLTSPLKHSSSSTDEYKSWKAIDESFRQAILFASSTDGETAPTLPSKRLLRILNTKTGPTGARIFRQWHQASMDFCIQPGMALHISKAQITSTPSPFTIDTFSPFFCAPTRAGFKVFSNDEMNQFEIYANSFNISAIDIKKMTSCQAYIPTRPDIFISQLRNFDAVLSDILTPDSLIRNITTEIMINHFERNEHMYFNNFGCHDHFGVWLLNRLHFKIQSILHQCYQVENVVDINYQKFSMQEELDQIDTMSFIADAPYWYRDHLDKNENTNTNHSGHSGSRRNRSPSDKRSRDNQNHNNDKRTRVTNNDNSQTKLQQNEVYSKLVHYQNLEKCKDQAVQHKGEYICNNFHMRGHCFDTCKRNVTHCTLPPETARKYCTYVRALRSARDSFESYRKNKNSQKSNQGEQDQRD
jgi:hypothetical protein